jgi:hypothetical protein
MQFAEPVDDYTHLRRLYILLLLVSVGLCIASWLVGPAAIARCLGDGTTLTKALVLRVLLITGGAAGAIYAMSYFSGNVRVRRLDRRLRTMVTAKPLMSLLMLLWIAVLALAAVNGLGNALTEWSKVEGWEYHAIAKNVAEGRGFSLPNSERWMFSPQSVPEGAIDEAFPTALEEPIYPLLLGGSLATWGEAGMIAMLVLQVVAHIAACVLTFFLGRAVFTPMAGVLASVVLALMPAAHTLVTWNLTPSVLGAAFVVASALVILRCLRAPSVGKGVAAGALFGFGTLTLSTILPYLPLAAVLVVGFQPRVAAAWKSVAAMVLTTVLVVAPWTVRNTVTFGEVIPVKTGLGIAAHHGNVILAATFTDTQFACTDTLGPMWRAADAEEALRISRTVRSKRLALYERSLQCIERDAPPGYVNYSESERDRVYLAQALAFISAEPETFLALTVQRGIAFFTAFHPLATIIAALAAIGFVLAIRSRQAWVLFLLVFAYAGPYFLLVLWVYRYRFPVEPLLLLFSAHAVVAVASSLLQAVRPGARQVASPQS